jgi:hypothetical protein
MSLITPTGAKTLGTKNNPGIFDCYANAEWAPMASRSN